MNASKRYYAFFAALFFVWSAASAQVSLNRYHIAVGNSSNQLSGGTDFQYNSGQLIMGSASDNYLSFSNAAGTSHIQGGSNGDFIFWTPAGGGLRKMTLKSGGLLKLGTRFGTNDVALPYSANNATVPNCRLAVDGSGYFSEKLIAERIMTNSDLSAAGFYSASANSYLLSSTITNQSYHAAQENIFNVDAGTPISVTGYQSAAQTNTAYLYKTIYSDMGAGQVWSVQTNTFYPNQSTISKYANAYIRTQLGASNTIGTYYTMFLEAPFGQGSASQITNYYGIYQESAEAKNYFGGKLSIGTTDTYSDYKLAVAGNILAEKLKIKLKASGWPDYVFHSSYQLPSLSEVERFIKAHKHLPGVPSAAEVEEKGLDVGDTQATLLKKIEELTLYVIELNGKVERQAKELNELKAKANQ